MTKKDIFTLWEEEGDLERMRFFFQNINPGPEQKDRIKQLALEKIRQEEARQDLNGTENMLEFLDMTGPFGSGSETLRERLRRMIKSLWWRWHWKLAVPVAALLLVVFIGQAGMDGSFELSLNQMKSTAESQNTKQSAPGLYDMAGIPTPKATDNSVKHDEGNRGFTAGGPPASNAALSKEKASSSNAIAPPLLPPELKSPPADESLPRKMTYNMNASLQVEDVNSALERITREVKSLGGYVVESSQDQYQNNASAHATLKIPSNKLEGFRGLLPDFGKVLSQHTTANDITNRYYDAETRLRSWEAQEARYLEILKEAHTVEDILKIENSLGSIRTQIEQLKGQLKLWDHEVNYSTIQLNLQTTPNPVNINDPWQPVSWSKTWQAAKDAVLKTLSSTWNGLNYLIIGIAYALPVLILAGILFGIYKGVKKILR